MTRAFHILAAALLMSVLAGLSLRGDVVSREFDPREQLVALMKDAGFERLGAQRIVSRETLLTFRATGCAAPVEIVYLPGLNRISDAARALIARADGTRIFVHDGEIIGGIEAYRLLPRWAWRRALVAFSLAPSQPWQSTALAVFDRSDCIGDRIDWRRLTEPAAV